jgi:uncharacterized protein involved in type VI secretion and phage assembly
MRGISMLSELLAAPERDGRFFGVTVGIVTNNKDEEGLGRVKVKFPWLSDSDESYWARVLTPMAGKEMGIYFLPEVNDEVLVAFAHGDMESPYILGAVWNGEDKPPETNSDGKNNLRLIKSRSGHQIILDDTEGQERIVIRDRTEKNEIVIDSKENTLSLKVEKDITIEAKGKITTESQEQIVIRNPTKKNEIVIDYNKNSLSIKVEKDITIEAPGKITIKSSNGDIAIEAKNLSFKAQQNCEIKADSNCNLQASGGMALKCSAGVKINNSSLEVM